VCVRLCACVCVCVFLAYLTNPFVVVIIIIVAKRQKLSTYTKEGI
jgi:hypothetical protein